METQHATILVRLYCASLVALGLIAGTGLIGEGDAWFSPWDTYRKQTDALLSGRFALSHDPKELEWDHAWSMGGVQQVWGLGVPLWQLPGQALARLAGFGGFPERVSFALFICIVAYVVIKVWGDLMRHTLKSAPRPLLLIVVLVLIAFPPLVSMMRARFAMYEEAIAYAYFFAVLQATLLAALIMKPRRWLWWTLCGLGGIGAFIRPTLLLYGAATLVCGSLAMLSWQRAHRAERWEGLLKEHGGGIVLFCLGGGLLWSTNFVRFGDGLDFGHGVNLQTLTRSMYALRFDHPLQDEPLSSVSLELFGALFLPKNLNGQDNHGTGIFPGQSSGLRWREFSFDTYNPAYLLLLLVSWCLAGRALVGGRLFSLWNPDSNQPEPATILLTRIGGLLGLWSLLSTVALVILYLRVPWMTSRYTVDFGAAFAITLVSLMLTIWHRLNSRTVLRISVSVLFVCWAVDLLAKDHTNYWTPRYSAPQRETALGSADTMAIERAYYRNGVTLGDHSSGIPFDRTGWNQESGQLSPLFVLFVSNPDFLELEVETNPALAITSVPDGFRAKIATEQLVLESVNRSASGWILRFANPRKQRYRSGLHAAFIATVPKQRLGEEQTPWILKSVQWRSGDVQGKAESDNK